MSVKTFNKDCPFCGSSRLSKVLRRDDYLYCVCANCKKHSMRYFKQGVRVSLKLLKDIYDLLCESSKIDWDDRVTSRLEKVITKNEKKKI